MEIQDGRALRGRHGSAKRRWYGARGEAEAEAEAEPCPADPRMSQNEPLFGQPAFFASGEKQLLLMSAAGDVGSESVGSCRHLLE